MSESARAAEPQDHHQTSAISQANIGLAGRTASWPLSKQIALLNLARTSLTQPVYERLMRGTARPGQSDYWDLMARERFAYRETVRGKSILILTPQGRREATELAWAWAKELRLHLLRRGESRFDCTGHCSCGASFSSRKSRAGANNIGSQFGAHRIAVENGSWKPFDLAAFMAKLDAQFKVDADALAAREFKRRATG